MDEKNQHLVDLLAANWRAANNREVAKANGFTNEQIEYVKLGVLATTCIVLSGIANNTGLNINDLVTEVGLPEEAKGKALEILTRGILKRS